MNLNEDSQSGYDRGLSRSGIQNQSLGSDTPADAASKTELERQFLAGFPLIFFGIAPASTWGRARRLQNVARKLSVDFAVISCPETRLAAV